MTIARKRLIDVAATPYYMITARCVRRAYLCGECHLTGKNYEHRKLWVEERLAFLSRVFAIDIAAYAVMSNHYHLVLRIDADRASQWSDGNVIRRWKRLFRISPIIAQSQKETASKAIKDKAQELIEEWRNRLMDISWFMRTLNEYLARKANGEDHCTGRFWEGRFKSTALLDEAAVITAMAYVDLNPIRAKVAKAPESSKHTSIEQRIRKLKKQPISSNIKLMTLSSSTHQPHKNSVALSTKDYLELIDWSGRLLRKGKRGAIDNHQPPILERLNLDAEGLMALLSRTDDIKGLTALGSSVALTYYIEFFDKFFLKGQGINRKLYTT